MSSDLHAPIAARTEALAAAILDGAFAVHRTLGPGLLESVYEVCLCRELSKRGIEFERQMEFPVRYDGISLEAGLEIDLLVANEIIVEIKAVERVIPVFEAQLLTYLKLTGHRLGFLINFNVAKLKDGIMRRVI